MTTNIMGAVNNYRELASARLLSSTPVTATYYNGPSQNGVGALLTFPLGAITIDGKRPRQGDRVVFANQTLPFQNGIYEYTIAYNATTSTAGVFERAGDFRVAEQMTPGAYLSISEGNANVGSIWVLNGPLIADVGVDNIIMTNPASAFSNENLIIGGEFGTNPWQRQTSVSGVSNLQFVADRFFTRLSSVADVDVIKSTDVPSIGLANGKTTASAYIQFNTVATPGAGSLFTFSQAIQGYRFAAAAGKPLTLSFCVYSARAGTYCVSLVNGAGNYSYVAEYTINQEETWEYKVISIALPDATKFSYDNTTALSVNFAGIVGTTYQTTAVNAWSTGLFYGTVNQVNATTGSNLPRMQFDCIKLEIGSLVTPYKIEDEAKVFEDCAPYYQKSYGSLAYPGAFPAPGLQEFFWFGGPLTGADNTILHTSRLLKKMRNTPTVVIYNPNTGATGSIYNYVTAASMNVTVFSAASKAFSLKNLSDAAGDSLQLGYHFTASAELT